MFRFVIKYLGFLKFVPGLPLLFDIWLKLYIFITHMELLNWMDEISAEVQEWPDVIIHPHKYGGIQFDFKHKEIGHLHGNGLLDMPFDRQLKKTLIEEGHVEDHHLLKNTGWISFYIRTEKDKYYALRLLRLAYKWREDRYTTGTPAGIVMRKSNTNRYSLFLNFSASAQLLYIVFHKKRQKRILH